MLGVELVCVEGEFAEAPGQVDVWVGGVGDGGFDEGWTRIEEEGQRLVDGEVDSSAGDVGDCDGACRALSADLDGAVFGEWGADVAGRCGMVCCLAV